MFIEGGISHRRSAYAVQTKYLSLPVPSVQKKKEMNTEQCRQQSSLAVEHRLKHLENCYAPHLLEVDYIKDLLFFSAVHILLSI